jgi:hypothetical protein
MGTVFGYCSNDFSLVPSAFGQVGDILDGPNRSEIQTWGLGFIENNEALLRKGPEPNPPRFRFRSLVEDLRTRCIVGQTTAQSIVNPGSDQPPYRFRGWLMGHLGESLDFDEYEQALRDELPNYASGAVAGPNPSELLTHVAVYALRRIEKSPSSRREAAVAVARAVRFVRKAARASGTERPPGQTYILANGEHMLASCVGEPTYFRVIDGIVDDPVLRAEALFAGHEPKRVTHPSFKAVFFAAGIAATEDWSELPDNSVAFVDEAFRVQVEPLEGLLDN